MGPIALAALTLALSSAASDPAEQLLDRARLIEARQAPLSRVWPGYWPDDQPFVLYLPEVGAVFGGRSAPDGPRFKPGPLEDVRFAFVIDYPVSSPNTVLLRLNSIDDDLSTLFHEQFHDYQSDTFRWVGDGSAEFVDLSGVADRKTFTIEIERERRLLSQALAATEPTQRRLLTRQYLTARETRLASVPAGVRAAEDHREWSEGTAEYAAVLALTILEPEGPSAAARLRAKLDTPLVSEKGSYLSAVFRWRAYGVGAAQAWLLDDLAVPDWRRRIERGARMTSVLDEALTAAGVMDAPAPAPLDSEAREEILRQLAALDDGPADQATFLASQSHWLVLELTVPPEQFADLTLNFRADDMRPLPGGAVALPVAGEFIAALGKLRLEARGRPTLIEPGQDGTRMVFSIALADEAEAARLAAGEPIDGIILQGVSLEVELGRVIATAMP